MASISLATYLQDLTSAESGSRTEFETAAGLRDEIRRLEAYDLEMPANSLPINAEWAAGYGGGKGQRKGK